MMMPRSSDMADGDDTDHGDGDGTDHAAVLFRIQAETTAYVG